MSIHRRGRRLAVLAATLVALGVAPAAAVATPFCAPVSPFDIAPYVAVNDSFVLPFNTKTIQVGPSGVRRNDGFGANLSSVSATHWLPPLHGSLALAADGSFTYTASANWSGDDSFTYVLQDTQLKCSAIATVTIVANYAQPWVSAGGDGYEVVPNTTLVVPPLGGLTTKSGVLLNDGSSTPFAQLSVELLTNPAQGTLTMDTTNGSFTYAPPAGVWAMGTSWSFTYRACETSPPHLCSATATVSLTVGALLKAVDDTATVVEDGCLRTATPGPFDICTAQSPSVTANDVLNTANRRMQIVSQATRGSVSPNGNGDGTFYYGAAPDYFGPDSFTYRMCIPFTLVCGNTATVSITVTPVPDAPVAVLDSYKAPAGLPRDLLPMQNDTSVDVPDGGELLAPAFDVEVVDEPLHGTAAAVGDGKLRYTSEAGHAGIDTFRYRTCAIVAGVPGLCSAPATIVMAVSVPVAAADSVEAFQGVAQSVDVLANDSDSYVSPSKVGLIHGPYSVIVLSFPEHGDLDASAGYPLSYTSEPDYDGEDTFTYKVCAAPPRSDCSAAGRVTMVVWARPVAVADEHTVADRVRLDVAAPGVLDNDTTARLIPLSAQAPSSPAHGDLLLQVDGSFTYEPYEGFRGVDSFTYKVWDGWIDSLLPGTVTLIVPNAPPVASDDTGSVIAGATLHVQAPGVLANDGDDNADPLFAELDGPPEHGALTLVGDGSYTYMPAAGYAGEDSFSYRADDGTDLSEPATVRLVVTRAAPTPTPTPTPTATPIPTPTPVAAARDRTPGGASPPGGAHPASADLVVPRSKRVRVSARHRGRLRLSCAGDRACAGAFRIRAGKVVIAEGGYAVPAGATAGLAFKVSPRGRALLRKGGGRLKATLVLRPPGGTAVTQPLTLVRRRASGDGARRRR